MAGGTLWARQHRGSSGKVFIWAHNEHVDHSEIRSWRSGGHAYWTTCWPVLSFTEVKFDERVASVEFHGTRI